MALTRVNPVLMFSWYRILFQADVNAKPAKELKIYQMMVNLLHAEKKCLEKIRDSEEEVLATFFERFIRPFLTVFREITISSFPIMKTKTL